MVEQYLTAEELARKLNVPISWIYSRTRARCTHAMPVLRVGKYCRFVEKDVIEWLKTLANNAYHNNGK